MRQGEERSDELRRRVYWISLCTYVSSTNFFAAFNVMNTLSFTTRFARRSFDLINPIDFVRENDIQMKVELWDNNAWNDDILGEAKFSAVRFLSALEPQEEWLPLTYPGDESSNSKVQLEFKFEEAKVGMAVFTLYEAKNLGTSEMKLGGNVLSPYMSISMGDAYHKRSQTQVNGGQDPYFGEEQILMWIDEENWTKPAALTCWHEDIGDHDVIGKHELSLLPYMVVDPDDAKQELIPLQVLKETTHEGVKAMDTGELMMKCEFLAAGTLKMHIKSGRNLRETESIGRLDPYIVFKTEGYAVKINKRTTVDKDGGSNPDWNQIIAMDLVDHYQLQIECYDHDVLASTDELVGKANISLLPVFKKGHVDTWITLKHKNQYNVLKDAGEIHVVFDFKGEHGVSFPQHQPNVDAYDDTHRIDFEKARAAEEKRLDEAKAGIISTGETANVSQEVVLAQDILNHTDKPKVSYNCGFNDDEIRAAFEFIDLDNNDYVGAAEIRHVLICMGELVTDEEVDMMITMVDSDGDGQVGYGEFYMMVTDEDPSRPDFGKSDDTLGKRPDEAKSFERQREMAARDLKRRMLTQVRSSGEERSDEALRILHLLSSSYRSNITHLPPVTVRRRESDRAYGGRLCLGEVHAPAPREDRGWRHRLRAVLRAATGGAHRRVPQALRPVRRRRKR